MHVDHRTPQIGGHVVERLVTQDAGVVDDDVDASEGVQRGLYDRRAALGRGDRVGVGDGLATGRLDLVDDSFRGSLVAAGAVDGTAEVVHDDQRPTGRHQQRVLAAEASAGARDDRHLAVETKSISHGEHGIGRPSAAPNSDQLAGVVVAEA